MTRDKSLTQRALQENEIFYQHSCSRTENNLQLLQTLQDE